MDLLGQLSRFATPLATLLSHALTPARTVPLLPRPAEPCVLASVQVQRRLREPELKDLAAAYDAGASHRELAAQFGIHRQTVASHLARAGITVRAASKCLSEQDMDVAVGLYRSGRSLAEVASRFGVSPRVFRRIVISAGVAIRPKGRRPGRER